MSLLDRFLQRLESVPHDSAFPRDDPQHLLHENESRIPLLPHAMADDKLKPGSPVLEALGSDSESSSRDVVSEYKKAPWWSYIWASLLWVRKKRWTLTLV